MRRALAATVASLTIAAIPGFAFAQAGSTLSDPPLPCSAFVRSAGGDWTVTAPAMLDFNGMLVSFTVGTHLTAGSSPHGIAMPMILDRQCGNRPVHALRP